MILAEKWIVLSAGVLGGLQAGRVWGAACPGKEAGGNNALLCREGFNRMTRGAQGSRTRENTALPVSVCVPEGSHPSGARGRPASQPRLPQTTCTEHARNIRGLRARL